MNNGWQQTVPNILYELARVLGTEVNDRKLEIPEKFGKGYCVGFIFNKHIRMLISNYELKEDIVVNNPDIDTGKRMLFFKFQNIFPKTDLLPLGKLSLEIPSVLIATSRINIDEVIAIHSNTATINVEIDSGYLNELFSPLEKSPVLQSLLQNTQPLVFDQLIYPSLQKVVNEILIEPVGKTFKLYFLRVKAEELVCRLLMELEKREQAHLYALNSHDIGIIYKVKEQILEHLETPPVIKELVIYAGMSPTKLKRLFRQVFGNSIFSYYQEFRLKEAARMLKEEKLSVSDVGYQLGFTNLSHFSKVFKEQLGVRPKQYSR